MASFNLHSVAVAILSDQLAQRGDVEYSEGAFAAGLFHDLGLLLVALGLPEEYQQISLLHRQSPKWTLEYERQVLGLTHVELSAEALASWNIPEPIQIAVRFADTPDMDPTPAEADAIRLSRVLNASDRYVNGTGTSLSLFEGTPEDGQLALEALGLGERLPMVLADFKNEFSAIQSYF